MSKPKGETEIDRLLGGLDGAVQARRLAWVRDAQGLTDRERAALTRAIKGNFGPDVTSADLRTGVAALDRIIG